ncbi:hypothetical protein [Clostridium novyi]|uniref:hypothetical protein n=1 Tax=Clostridium novyi TaxID=1542 RepID=UPI0004D4E087|nr:hypothetical protein [Clostridium novyi]KEI08008.1 hypothetical protein Z958_p0083 [Clostridium novyi B str. NCTC 9691]KEI12744.1 hypothetical protein Z958_05535 [Clostridium novyi B str. NCTC 9691]
MDKLIDYKKPRQKMWGVLKDKTVVSCNYGGETDDKGNEINNYATNCYDYALAAAKEFIAKGAGTKNVQIVEFVPYDFMMQPRV